jgi:hypothetical protein
MRESKADLVIVRERGHRHAGLDRLNLADFCRLTGLHPDVVRRFVALGLLDGFRDARGDLWFLSSQLALVARIQRLHDDLSLNYAAVGLVIDLLDRIRQLQTALRKADSVRRWN